MCLNAFSAAAALAHSTVTSTDPPSGSILPASPARIVIDFNEPARLYWFRTVRSSDGVTFTPTLIDDDSGVGTQLTVADGNGDGRPDIVLSNKKGAFVFLQE